MRKTGIFFILTIMLMNAILNTSVVCANVKDKSIQTGDEKTSIIHPESQEQLNSLDTFYVVLKKEYSNPSKMFTKAYFPEINIKEFKNLSYYYNPNEKELLNLKSFRNIFEIFLK